MNFECSDVVELRSPPGLINLRSCWSGMMNGVAEGHKMDSKSLSHGSGSRKRSSSSFAASYFGVESLLVLVCFTVSLLILPLILPPLPPPPFMLLLLPIGILVVLMILAFMPSDIRDIASTYV